MLLLAAARGQLSPPQTQPHSASTAPAGCLPPPPVCYVHVHVHELPDSWGPGTAARLLQHHAGGHALRHYPGRSAGRAGVRRVLANRRVRAVAGGGGEAWAVGSSAGPSAVCRFAGGCLDRNLVHQKLTLASGDSGLIPHCGLGLGSLPYAPIFSKFAS